MTSSPPDNPHELVDELARVFHLPSDALFLVRRTDFPRESIPIFEQPRVFWNFIWEAIDSGTLKEGRRRLAEEAAKLHPNNQIFTRHSKRAPPPKARECFPALDPEEEIVEEAVRASAIMAREICSISSDDLFDTLEQISESYERHLNAHKDIYLPAIALRNHKARSRFREAQLPIIESLSALYEKFRPKLPPEFQRLQAERYEEVISKYLLGPILAQWVWRAVDLDLSSHFDPRQHVEIFARGIGLRPPLPPESGNEPIMS